MKLKLVTKVCLLNSIEVTLPSCVYSVPNLFSSCFCHMCYLCVTLVMLVFSLCEYTKAVFRRQAVGFLLFQLYMFSVLYSVNTYSVNNKSVNLETLQNCS